MSMPRPERLDPPVKRGPLPPRDRIVTLRITGDALAAVDRLAADEQRSRSDMLRVLLSRGLAR